MNLDLAAARAFRPASIALTGNTARDRHPTFDVGEFLPPEVGDSIEVARLVLASTTGDVVSIRATRTTNGYAIDVYDEYTAEYEYGFEGYRRDYAQIPTQGEMIDLLTAMTVEEVAMSPGQPYVQAVLENNELSSIEEALAFLRIDSRLYPELNSLLRAFLVQEGLSAV